MKPRQLLRRIKAIERIKKITKAMEVVASTQLRKVESRLNQLTPYMQEFTQLVKELYFNSPPDAKMWFFPRSDDNYLIIVIGSDRGLCGAFNVNILNEVKRMIQKLELAGKKIVDIIPIGKKCSFYFRKHYEKEGLINYSGKEFEFARIVTGKVISSFKEKKVDNVILISTAYRGGAYGKFNKESIIPLKFEGEPKRRDYIIEPEWNELLEEVLPEYINARIYYRLIESRVAEELSRMLSMKYATDNAEEMIGELTLKFHRARQSQITREILEITQAGEALR